ncbi:cysteine-rich with EGF-like domain protein 2 isoform X2 [Scaptodrosophila lebanonensis]|uniref:Cysteine-rich with EGF-like domain protein 2 isoform X2 n=1 Tax=Drosophila lebanonensis TaxID=7225 RepID=A0A6J2U0A1_DROLE|nr:cysteine-rich with EGF-like domain protein 2 isoform X2 [Scaptodrosophila lebanonensis]
MLFQSVGMTVIALLTLANAEPSLFNSSPKEQRDKSAKLPPCSACKSLVKSFELGLERTKRGKHAGGDAAWEEEKLRSYKTSEVRLVEIQEQLCGDVKRGQDSCHSLANEHESLIEDWFLHKQNEWPDLHEWLCITTLKVCCPAETYGSSCQPCSSCSGNGKCKGAGTRKGNGQCSCDSGYTGSHCDKCAEQYYESFRDASKLLCTPCHAACSGGCTGAGPNSCQKCNPGWHRDSDNGCVDINECLEQNNVCRLQQFCVNNEGSYTCLECDRSCNGCDGDGPDMCRQCADGYKLKDGKCQVGTATEASEVAMSIETAERVEL